MKIVKKILIAIVVIVTLLLITALFIKNDYTVKRELVINKPKQEVFDYIKLLKNQENYNTWAMMDPSKKVEYKGTDGTVGFMSAWDSDKEAGKGEQEIVAITEGTQINFELRFIKPFEGKAYTDMVAKDADVGETKVTWTFKGHTPYPFNLMHLFMSMDEMMGTEMDKSLGNLKTILEK